MNLKIKMSSEKKMYMFFYFFIFGISCFILKDGIINAEDRCYEFFYNGIKAYKPFFYGSWQMHLENLLMFFTPHSLELNIVDWSNSFGVIFQSLCITTIIATVGKFGQLNNKLKAQTIIPVMFIAFCSFFLMFCQYNDPLLKTKIFELFIFLSFFRFFVATCLLVIFFYNLYKLFLNKKTSLIFTMICAFFLGCAGEYMVGISLTTVTLAILFKLFFEKKAIKDLKNYIYIFLTICIGYTILFFTEGYQYFISIYSEGYHFSLSNVISDIPNFFKMYYERMFVNYWHVYAILIGLFTLSYEKNKQNLAKNVFPLFIVAGTLTFSATLIVLGKNSYFGNYWLDYRDFYTIYSVLYTVCISIAIYNFISDFSWEDNKSIQKTLTFLCIIISIPFVYHANIFMTEKYNIKKFFYCVDKMRLFYEYKGIAPHMPSFYRWNTFVFIRNEKLSDFESDRVIIGEDPFDDEYFDRIEDWYYSQAYHINFKNRTDSMIIEPSNVGAIEYFEKHGGNFNEVKQGKLKFENLEDKDFVLGEKEL